jgi:hypothetical protein
MTGKFGASVCSRAFSGASFRSSWVALLTLFVAILGAPDARAAGSFKLNTTTVSEVSGGWHLYVTLELPRAPATAHVPVKFLFTKEVVYERALIDNHADPVLNRTVLSNQTPSVESLDVDFANSTGKIYKGTRFDFSLTRTRGYEAGEYKVQVRTSDGIDIGGTARLTLNGDNPVVDRRSMTFNAKDSSMKKVEAYDAGANGPPKADTAEDTPTQSQDVAPSGSASPFIPSSAYDKTPEEEIKTKPGGCGCEMVGRASGGSNRDRGLALASLLTLGIAFRGVRRRRRDTRAST